MTIRRFSRLLLAGLLAGTVAAAATAPRNRPAARKAPPAPEPGLTSLPAWDGAALRGTGPEPLPAAVVPAFPGQVFHRPVQADAVPGSDDLLVLEVDGRLSLLSGPEDAPRREAILELGPRSRALTEAYRAAFHPQYPAKPYLYLRYHEGPPRTPGEVVVRFTATGRNPLRLDPASEVPVFRWDSNGHNGGDLRFGPDGMLYLSSGDGVRPGDAERRGQRVDVITGGILRIDVDHPAPGQGHAVPDDNPFTGRPGVRPEYWAYGMRNPWRMWFSPDGSLWAGDNGEDHWEALRRVERGTNHGWSAFEGTHPFHAGLRLGGPVPTLTAPVFELPHTESRSILGGLTYRGRALPWLRGWQVFGDYSLGTLWAFRWEGGAARDLHRIAAAPDRPLTFGEDAGGEILLGQQDGRLMRVVPARPPAGPRRPFPARLSATGLFADPATLRLAPGVLPYSTVANPWMDGASARRALALPAGTTMTVTENGESWRLPDGAALVRTIELPGPHGPVRVETQVMSKEEGTWQFHSFVWNAAQDEAELAPEDGATVPVPGLPGRTWTIPGRAECRMCHRAQTQFLLGLSTAQLNRDFDYHELGGRTGSQLATLAAIGWLDRTVRRTAPRGTDPADATAPLEPRARAYLAVNCAPCHRRDGGTGRASFQAPEYLPLALTGLVHGPAHVPLQTPGGELVVPGHPEQSELIHRLTADVGRMPLLGGRTRDEPGIELLRTWIRQLAELPSP